MMHKYLGKSDKDCFYIKGVDLFRHKWKTVGDCAAVMEPESKRVYTFSVYEVEQGNRVITFIAGKNYDGEWLFFDGQ